jgi:hypothetical protein
MNTRLVVSLAITVLLAPAVGHAQNEIGWIEKFALAPDREAVLDQLLPGSEDFYFYHALHYQNTRQAAKLSAILDQWAKRYPASAQRRIIENRAALLAYDADPQATLRFLRDRLKLEFNDQQQARDQKPELPTKLDPAQINHAAFQRVAFAGKDDLSNVNDDALETLLRDKVPLSPSQRRDLLRRLKRPDVPGLVDLVAADLATKESRGFGEFEIHRSLLPEQLDDLAGRIPALYGNQNFVYARIRKLAPSADADAEFDLGERQAWLDRLWAYVKNLSPSFNSLKAQVLLQRLELDRQHGIYDKARFREYIKLPRRAPWVNLELLRRAEVAAQTADLNADFGEALAALPVIRSDEELVRDYLLHLLKDEPSWEPWAVWLRDTWLKPVFAEAKMVNGVGDPEKWASLLTPQAFQALKDRVDVDFSPANPSLFAPGDDVNLDLFLKNTPKLIVKIYEINTLSYFLANPRQLNTDLALDGLVANREMTHDFSADDAGRNPFRRTQRSFKFPELNGRRGAWVIEFIGGGRSSRALVRKGQWSLLQRVGPAGDMLTVLDENRQPTKDAVAWLDGRKFVPDEKSGEIVVPFTQQPGNRPIILADAAGSFATLTSFEHHAEEYALDAQIHIEREQLLAGRDATIAVRAGILLGGSHAPLALLQEPKLTITSTTLDGVSATREIKDLKLDPAKVLIQGFPVPDRLASLQVTLSGKVENLSKGGEKQELSFSRSFPVNGINRTVATNDGRFSLFGEDHVFELLGRNGEPIPDTDVRFRFFHRDFQIPVIVSLATDAKGRVELGKLEQIARVEADTPFDRSAWFYNAPNQTTSGAIHAPAGQPIRVPWTGLAAPKPGEISLLELRAGTFVRDYTAAVALVDGFLEIKSLPPGDYSLFIDLGNRSETTLRVTAGQPVGSWLVSPTRELEVRNAAPVHIQSVQLNDDAVVVKVRNVNAFTRVHVAASRFVPMGNIFESLGGFARFEGATAKPARHPNLFAAGRAIGDEYRYILERRYARIFPGNMLPRPGLLLSPWEVRSTELAAQSQAVSELLQRRAGGREGQVKQAERSPAAPPPPTESDTGPDVNFLGESAVTLYNLVPDADGIVRVDRRALGNHSHIQVYAEDLHSAEEVSRAYPEMPMPFHDLRLTHNLDPQKPFAEKKEVSVLNTGQTLQVADMLTAELETYDSLARAFTLLTTLSTHQGAVPGVEIPLPPPPPEVTQGKANLVKFAWIIQWPKLSDDEKRAKYSEFACHELNFFLARKDPPFFQKVVLPYLRNKKDRTFMDDYLLGNDLHGYLEPWAFAQLNSAERCLLAQHLPGEAAHMARHERELWELLTPDAAYEDFLFETGLRGRSLAESELGDFAMEKANRTRAMDAAKAEPAPAPVPALLPQTPGPGEPGLGKAGAAGTNLRGAMAGRLAMPAAAAAVPATTLAARDKDAAEQLGIVPEQKNVEGMLKEEVEREREQVRQFFRALGPTKEWAENNYYHLPIGQQTSSLVPVNAFWRDYAAWDGKPPFVSANIAEAANTFPEMMLAMAVLDLPFESQKQTTRSENGQFTLTAAGPVIAFHKEIKPAAPAAEQAPLLVSQNFFRADDRFRMEGNEKFDKYITDEFLAGVVYAANVVVTNPTSARQKVSALLQIPRGAISVNGSKATDSRRLQLEPYSTQTLEYYFYFPAPAAEPLPHYPVHVARDGQTVGEAKPFTFKVVPQLTQIDKTSWDYISQYATDDEVFEFLDKSNIQRQDLGRIAWRVRKSADFFRRLVAVMEKRHVYNDAIYRYAIVQNEAGPLATWLRQQDAFIGECGPYLDSKLLKIDPIERRAYEHLEYSPLVNQRIHRLGAENRIPNPVLRAQYQSLLNVLAHKSTLDAMDQMSVVYYQFLQDRVEEALARFAAIAPEALPTRLQHDYFRCYAAFYEEQPAVARGIAQQYADYPVDRWRKLFAEVSAQLDEIEGKHPARPGDQQPNREKQQAELAATEPSFDFKVENRQIALTWKNLGEVTIRYYLMDPEFLFSASPFVTQDSGRFSIIKATRTDTQALPEGKDQLSIPLPGEFTRANVLVEILGAGQRKAKTFHANTLRLNVAENYGRLEVRDDTENKPVSKAYVKVYARLRNGTVRFYKDGYTDLRGRFDYASLNSSETQGGPVPALRSGGESGDGLNYQMLSPGELDQVERFAILLMSENHGADVREAAPPAQ